MMDDVNPHEKVKRAFSSERNPDVKFTMDSNQRRKQIRSHGIGKAKGNRIEYTSKSRVIEKANEKSAIQFEKEEKSDPQSPNEIWWRFYLTRRSSQL
jgi:hypothetical protein